MVGIYKITSPKGRIYIGQSVDIKKREYLYSKKFCKSQNKIYNSILKYGWEKHKFEIVEECGRSDLNNREIYWGKFFKCLDKRNLNLRLGGSRGEFSEEILKQMKLNNLGVSRNKGIPKTQEHKKKLSEAVKRRIYTPERLLNMKKGMLGKNSTSIICINTNENFLSIREASKKLNISERTISNNLLGYTKTTKNKLKFKYINI